MAVDVEPLLDNAWQPLPRADCINVDVRRLLRRDGLGLAQLRFGRNATIDEHDAPFEIDVICLAGAGYVSVAGEMSRLLAGERGRWPAGKLHQLWTEGEDEMMTLMVEHWNGN